jgi:hypothetical protein
VRLQLVHRVTATALLLALLAMTTGACSPSPIGGSVDAVLVSLDMTGGMCATGACAQHVELRADGTVVGPDGSKRSLGPMDIARAHTALERADLAASLARPFTGQCPVVYDGAEWTWTFPAPGGPVVVASCTTQIDPRQQPFATLTELMVPAGG